MIIFNNVSKHYPNGSHALKNISFALDKGETAFLTGHSGAGKSTLLKLITRAETCTSGEIFFNDQPINALHRKDIPYLRRKIGTIFQTPYLLNDRTVFDNVALPLIITGYSKHDIKRRVRAALDKVSLLDKATDSPLTLSLGEQQRVGIARAVVNKPTLLLADEPTGNLDPKLSMEIMQLFDLFAQTGVTVLVASHDLSLIAQLKHPIMTLNQGQLNAR